MVIWVSPSIQKNKLNQWNLVLQAAVVTMTSWTLADWKIYTGVHVTIVQSCQHLLNVYNCCEEFPDLLKDKLNDVCINRPQRFWCVMSVHKFVFTKQSFFSNSCRWSILNILCRSRLFSSFENTTYTLVFYLHT